MINESCKKITQKLTGEEVVPLLGESRTVVVDEDVPSASSQQPPHFDDSARGLRANQRNSEGYVLQGQRVQASCGRYPLNEIRTETVRSCVDGLHGKGDPVIQMWIFLHDYGDTAFFCNLQANLNNVMFFLDKQKIPSTERIFRQDFAFISRRLTLWGRKEAFTDLICDEKYEEVLHIIHLLVRLLKTEKIALISFNGTFFRSETRARLELRGNNSFLNRK